MGDLAQTGFGTVTIDLGRALLDKGVDVRFVSSNEVGKLPPPFLERTVDMATFEVMQTQQGAKVSDLSQLIPGLLGGDSYATLTDGTPYGRWKPDAALVVADFWGARYVIGGYVPAFTECPTFHYVPIEGVGLPPSWKEMWDVVTPMAMSRFGQVEIAKVTNVIPPLMYHGVDTDVFHPVSPSNPVTVEWTNDAGESGKRDLASKEACKVAWQRFVGAPVDPSRLMLLRTDRHVVRKNYNAMLRALAPVLARNPNTDLVIHCRPMDEGGRLDDTLSHFPENVRSRIFLTGGPKLDRNALVALYNAADIYVSSCAEGFGLTIAEAIACGVPAVGLDYSAVPEVIGPAGQTVPVSHLTDNPYDHFWAHPDEDALGRAVEYLITHPSKRREMGAAGPGHVRRHFSWKKAAEVLLEAVEGRQAETLAVAA